jgi:hypothetical protein
MDLHKTNQEHYLFLLGWVVVFTLVLLILLWKSCYTIKDKVNPGRLDAAIAYKLDCLDDDWKVALKAYV